MYTFYKTQILKKEVGSPRQVLDNKMIVFDCIELQILMTFIDTALHKVGNHFIFLCKHDL